MRAAVFSDSHEDMTLMRRMTSGLCPDAIIHLGDHASDAAALHSEFPDIPMYSVAGNNDDPGEAPATLEAELGGVRLLLTHGHLFGVHQSTERLRQYALARGCRAALFGHTHEAFADYHFGVWLLNPGKAGKRPYSPFAATFGLLTLEQGRLTWELVEMPEN